MTSERTIEDETDPLLPPAGSIVPSFLIVEPFTEPYSKILLRLVMIGVIGSSVIAKSNNIPSRVGNSFATTISLTNEVKSVVKFANVSLSKEADAFEVV